MTIIQSLKKHILPKGLTHAFGQKCQFFHYLFSLRIRVEIRFNNVLDRKEFSDCKNFFLKSQKSHFSTKNELTHAFGEKMQFFHYFFSAKIRLKTRFNNVLDRKETFSACKNFFLSQKSHFSKGC